jgi:hypothetical protein
MAPVSELEGAAGRGRGAAGRTSGSAAAAVHSGSADARPDDKPSSYWSTPVPLPTSNRPPGCAWQAWAPSRRCSTRRPCALKEVKGDAWCTITQQPVRSTWDAVIGCCRAARGMATREHPASQRKRSAAHEPPDRRQTGSRQFFCPEANLNVVCRAQCVIFIDPGIVRAV